MSESSAPKLNGEQVHAIHRDDYLANIADASERLRFQSEFAHALLKNLNLVNGGGILALLTLVGNSKATYDMISIWWSFAWFSLGLAFSLFAYFGAFFSQQSYMNTSLKQAWNLQRQSVGLEHAYEILTDFNRGNLAFYGGILSALLSLGFFVIAAFVALGGLL